MSFEVVVVLFLLLSVVSSLINKLQQMAQNDPERRIRRKAMELCMSSTDWVDASAEVKA